MGSEIGPQIFYFTEIGRDFAEKGDPQNQDLRFLVLSLF